MDMEGKLVLKKTHNEVDLSTLASYIHMKIALGGKVITNFLFFHHFL